MREKPAAPGCTLIFSLSMAFNSAGVEAAACSLMIAMPTVFITVDA